MQRFYTANTEHFIKLLIHNENRQNVDTHFIKLNNVEISEQENTGNTWKTIQLGIISEDYGLFALKSTSIKIENEVCLVTFSFVSLHTPILKFLVLTTLNRPSNFKRWRKCRVEKYIVCNTKISGLETQILCSYRTIMGTHFQVVTKYVTYT